MCSGIKKAIDCRNCVRNPAGYGLALPCFVSAAGEDGSGIMKQMQKNRLCPFRTEPAVKNLNGILTVLQPGQGSDP